MNTSGLPTVALIAGPTASGKSALAMALADLTPSVIVNADSMQVYRDLRVVTARPSEADEARHPHRLFGYIDGAEACSAARWATDARGAIAEAHGEGRLPIVVGGTGLYIRTLLDGIAPVPEINPGVRAEVRALPVAEAFDALTREDAEAATRLAPADTTRVARALEVVRSTGRTLKDWQAQKVGGIGEAVRLVPLALLPPRDWLFDRCDARFEAMIEAGEDEVAALIERDLDPALPVMRAIGVAEIAALLARKVSKGDCKTAGALATRQYAKRQYTWFVNQAPTEWKRVVTSLDSENIHNLVIILRDKALTA
ncbi:tRNA (adenosine(37)-N6)-dimethylallyltransferase MiaA [Sphingomonas sp. SUN039]|uniref:tRNA (adenosine(37)-N6)-dimethylallyltransferase MiaA n=1 Tax=Sphingomonas sp. SUN039 TaxID=2937787 RepID=UPI002164EDEB|nr:tRNA (adenosine(37)-N6)-dimethylallyltransferase MiaA [Sphingomonas sp. SUN039]UVO53894.1 tRNA (adenosine(37)-N6)-dimethylallyltransferase MiaA [Sphingomonas sp. SUN039]